MPAIVHSISTSEAGGRARQELAAMRAIATAIEDLPNDEVRVRVIRWVAEVFGLNVTLGQARTQTVSSTPPQRGDGRDDPSLTVDGIDELFESPAAVQPASSPAPECLNDDPTLAVDGIDALFESPAGTGRPEPARRSSPQPSSRAYWKDELPAEPEERPAQAASTTAAVTLQGLVDDLQKLAREWRE
jgi:hypothetical protein